MAGKKGVGTTNRQVRKSGKKRPVEWMAGYNRLAGTKSWKEEAGRTDSWVQSIGRYERVNGSGRYNRRKGILRHENRKGTIVG